ncbi:carbon starvation protein A [candidate division KSB1 bacterium]|nr:carbon starvation protein A [candidate division KSB1 bacterium]
MSAIIILFAAVSCFIAAYVIYGRWLAKKLDIDPHRETPAHTMRDNIDYVPAKAPVLLGHHFASIAGAAPIIGPITAAVFGWVPVLLWLILGGIFIGAVHDFTSLVASIRHRGKSIGEVIETYVGHTGKQLFLIFAWATLVLVIAAFTILVVKTFVQTPAVGTSSSLFIALAIAFGFLIYRKNVSLGAASSVGVALLLCCVWLGIKMPIVFSENQALSGTIWTYIVLLYIFVASVTPVWILLQPRDYLNSFLLYMLLIGAFIGLLLKHPTVQFPQFVAFTDAKLGPMFPILFVTVACGAISGFHSLVASGTTAKQLNNERDAKVVTYGGMLIETLLAVIALLTAAILLPAEYKTIANPIVIFSNGVGAFMTTFGLPVHTGITFTALAVSAFALTSLDTATRLGRFAFQEYFKSSSRTWLTNRYVATFFTILPGAILALSGSYRAIWPIFGSANQLLAALALLAGSVWLAKRGIGNRFLTIPMVIMFLVTLSALVILIVQKSVLIQHYFYEPATSTDFNIVGTILLTVLAVLLFCVAIILAAQAWRSLKISK